MFCLSLFLWMGAIFPFFYSEENAPVRKSYLKTISNGTQIESPHIISMGILMLSSPWALYESRCWITFAKIFDWKCNFRCNKRYNNVSVCNIIDIRKKRAVIKN